MEILRTSDRKLYMSCDYVTARPEGQMSKIWVKILDDLMFVLLM